MLVFFFFFLFQCRDRFLERSPRVEDEDVGDGAGLWLRLLCPLAPRPRPDFDLLPLFPEVSRWWREEDDDEEAPLEFAFAADVNEEAEADFRNEPDPDPDPDPDAPALVDPPGKDDDPSPPLARYGGNTPDDEDPSPPSSRHCPRRCSRYRPMTSACSCSSVGSARIPFFSRSWSTSSFRIL